MIKLRGDHNRCSHPLSISQARIETVKGLPHRFNEGGQL